MPALTRNAGDATAHVCDASPASGRGDGVTIAVIDDAVDTRHPEFAGRVAPGCDVSDGSDSPLPRGWEPHGTNVAGLALAAGIRVSGVAPGARLMGLRVPALTTGTGKRPEAEAIRWAAEHGADVICCAWSPPAPTRRSGRLPDATRAAIDRALSHGRAGRGCVIVLSSGNDGADLARNGYASHPGVIAVGACNRHDKHPAYSGWGSALWCVYPSNDPRDPTGASASYITTSPIGSFLRGDTYYTTFGFTSAACAAVAGICALILSAAPDLTWPEVKDLLAGSCTPIDVAHGRYDRRGHSPLYGFGRPDAERAVMLAREKSRSRSI